jgi:hypothetical protein
MLDPLACSADTAVHRLAVHQDDATATLGGIAANMRAGETEMIPQELYEQTDATGAETIGGTPAVAASSPFTLLELGPERSTM